MATTTTIAGVKDAINPDGSKHVYRPDWYSFLEDILYKITNDDRNGQMVERFRQKFKASKCYNADGVQITPLPTNREMLEWLQPYTSMDLLRMAEMEGLLDD